jgi:hypothetical protein
MDLESKEAPAPKKDFHKKDFVKRDRPEDFKERAQGTKIPWREYMANMVCNSCGEKGHKSTHCTKEGKNRTFKTSYSALSPSATMCNMTMEDFQGVRTEILSHDTDVPTRQDFTSHPGDSAQDLSKYFRGVATCQESVSGLKTPLLSQKLSYKAHFDGIGKLKAKCIEPDYLDDDTSRELATPCSTPAQVSPKFPSDSASLYTPSASSNIQLQKEDEADTATLPREEGGNVKGHTHKCDDPTANGMTIPMHIDKLVVQAFVISGASYNFASSEFLVKNKLAGKLVKNKHKIRLGNKGTCETLGTVTLDVTVFNKTQKLRFLVLEKAAHSLILGRVWLYELMSS